MKFLWILRPKPAAFWRFGYGQAAGFVIRANTEKKARKLAHKHAGDELKRYPGAWLDPIQSTCKILTAEGKTIV